MKSRQAHFHLFASCALAVMLLPIAIFVFAVAPSQTGGLLMAAATLNFLDLAKANSNDVIGGLIEENTIYAPELSVFDSEDLMEPGQLSYETLHRTALPTVAFANAGEGFAASKSQFDLKKHECFRFGGRVSAARHIADNWRRGGAAGYQATEASGVMQAALQLIGRQIWYGRTYDGKGFPGMKAFTAFGGTYTLDAAGTTSSTASSVYLVKFGEMFSRLMVGRARNGNGLMDLPEFRIGDVADPADSTKLIESYISELSSYVGLQIACEYSVVRIANLTAETNKTLTDAKLTSAMALFPANFKPDAIFMSRRSRTQLQNSRTVTLYGQGTTRPNQELVAPLPTEFEGVPIVATDSILNTDAIES